MSTVSKDNTSVGMTAVVPTEVLESVRYNQLSDRIVCQLLLFEVELLSLSLATHHIECDSCR